MDKKFWLGVAVGLTPTLWYVGYVIYDTIKRYRNGTLFR